jgi:predicted esterase
MLRPTENHLRVSRTARYFVLGGPESAEQVASRDVGNLWFVLHGYGQLARDFVQYFADAATPARRIVAPEALNRYYLVPPDAAPAAERPVGATWMTREDRDNDIADYVAYLDALYDALRPGLAPDARVHVIGFSQGAATATRWALHGHVPIQRLVLWGGLLPPETPLDAPVLRSSSLTLVAGSRDKYLSPERLAAEEHRLAAAGIPARLIRFDGSHSLKRDVIRQLAAD